MGRTIGNLQTNSANGDIYVDQGDRRTRISPGAGSGEPGSGVGEHRAYRGEGRVPVGTACPHTAAPSAPRSTLSCRSAAALPTSRAHAPRVRRARRCLGSARVFHPVDGPGSSVRGP
jgi:hypothetical protein